MDTSDRGYTSTRKLLSASAYMEQLKLFEAQLDDTMMETLDTERGRSRA
eukprot:CAMPEP_0172524036 /NCGR_PEP_ID=MMETSP1066-20121228/293976_1 /TAXON_ID=671091 /ORGANISM="Coscinodiscus wailesii, Strain CCMP2513" /LENGTH=48 /DNA_ID= /DNA_START= /DNA_END= /DNA_ORIENTATION=